MAEVSDLVRDLLRDVPTEEVVNLNVGRFPEAVLLEAKVQENKSGSFSVKLVFSDNGRTRFASFQLPDADSHPMVNKKALDWQRALGLADSGVKRAYSVRGDTQDDRRIMAQKIVDAIQTASEGKTVPYQTTEDGDFERHTPIRG